MKKQPAAIAEITRQLDRLRELEEDGSPGNPPILLRLPQSIGMPLIEEARKKNVTIQALILSIVARHYEVENVPPARGRPRKTN